MSKHKCHVQLNIVEKGRANSTHQQTQASVVINHY